MLMNAQSLSTDGYTRERLRLTWLVIGGVLLFASVAQPLVAGQLDPAAISAQIAMMEEMTGQTGLSQMDWLFAGVFANIEFALGFAAVKFVLGLATVWAAVNFGRGDDRAGRVLAGITLIGVAAFIAIGLVFAATSLVFLMEGMSPFMALMMLAMAAVAVVIPARWLLGQRTRILALPFEG
jgi:hypothetical protein